MKVEPQTTKDKVIAVMGKKTGNKTRMSEGGGAGMIPFTKLEKKCKNLKRPRATPCTGW